MRVWLKRIGVICLVPIVLMLLVSLLLYVPPVQNFAVKKAMGYVAESTGIDVRFEHIRLSYPLNLSVRNALVMTAENDTLAYLDKLTVEVSLAALLEKNISVKEVHLQSLKLNTGNLLDGIIVKGNVGEVRLAADTVSLDAERALLGNIILSNADIDLFMCDTTAADTAASKVNWCIGMEKIELNNVAFTCRMPCDSIFLGLNINSATLSDGFVDLGAEMYCASGFSTDIKEIFYGTSPVENSPAWNGAASGLDFSNIRLTEAGLSLDSLYYNGATSVSVIIKECFAKERSGLVVKSLTGRIESDSVRINIPSFLLETAFSDVRLQGFVSWSSLNSAARQQQDGQFSLEAKARIDKKDALIIIGDKSEDFSKYYPDTVFHLDAFVSGDIAKTIKGGINAELPGAFKMDLMGDISLPANEHLRSGRVECALETKDIDFVVGMFPSMLQPRFRMPDSMNMTGHVAVDKGLYSTEIVLKESVGELMFSGGYDMFKKSYDAYLKIDSLEPIHFMPDDSVMLLNAFVRAKGQGTDVYHSSTWMELEGKVSEVCYGATSISDVSLSGSLKNNHLQAEIVSAYPLVRGSFSVNGDIKKDKIRGMFIADVDSLDFYGLKLSEMPFATSFQIFSELESDLDKTHSLDVTLGNWSLSFENQTVQPKMLTLSFRSDADTTQASFHAGDLIIALSGNADAETLSDKLTSLSKEAFTQLKSDTTVNLQALRPYFPEMSVNIKAERDNPVYNFLQEGNMFFEKFHIDAEISPERGLSANGTLVAFVKDTLKIDTVQFNIWQDTLGIQYEASVEKKRFRNQEAFIANASGYIRKDDADIMLSFVNSRGESGLSLGVNAKKTTGGVELNFYPENPVIAFLPFTINKDNYFRFRSIKEMEADLTLEGPSNASVWVHSGDAAVSMREMMIELSQINLESISDGLADIPSMRGLLNSTFRYEPMENTFMIMADGYITDFHYNNGRIGDLLLNATYMPMDKGTHQVDMHVFHNSEEVSSLFVLYTEGRYESKIDGAITIDKLPLSLIEVMMPASMARLDGFVNGDFTIKGTDKKPVVDGSLRIDSGSIYVIPSSTTLTFDDKPVKMKNNIVTFDSYKIYAQKDNPFVIDGTIDATNASRPMIDLRMAATNMQLIDSRRTPESIVFGRLFVNMTSTLRGTMESLRMRGNMRVLGSTNMTYIMLDSPLEVQDGFNNLVTFSYFADTLPRRSRRTFDFTRGSLNTTAMSGVDVSMNISIDPVVRMRVELDDEQANYVDLRGGGDLSLRYSTQGDMSLNGRYTLTDGTIRYSIPVIPLTNFSIKNGSYVDWDGDIMNPYLNIAAYTRVRSSVNLDGNSRMVDFNTGIQLRDNLEDVSIKFLLEAPTDAVIQNQLTTMGEEERSKQAASLLVTGVYLASGNMGNMDMGAALSSLLQRELKNMLGSMLGDVPLSIDVNYYDGERGDAGQHIDYIARFYKGFYNERINTALGLRYSTNDPIYGSRFILDDISAGYLLDTDGSRSINIFRSKDYENMFEGEIAKIGSSFSIRRKVKSIKDFFIFKKKDAVMVRREPRIVRKTEEESEVVEEEGAENFGENVESTEGRETENIGEEVENIEENIESNEKEGGSTEEKRTDNK